MRIGFWTVWWSIVIFYTLIILLFDNHMLVVFSGLLFVSLAWLASAIDNKIG